MIIRQMIESDRGIVMDMMRVFYRSPAVLSEGSDIIFSSDIDACVGDSPYAEGFVFEEGGNAAGYGMIAKSFSTEFGKPCIWIEDLYILPEHRGKGVASAFIQSIKCKYPDAVVRLEVEEENLRALAVYRRNGMQELPYMEMILK